MIALPIGDLIGYPMACYRGNPNRPRIARPVSCRVVSLKSSILVTEAAAQLMDGSAPLRRGDR